MQTGHLSAMDKILSFYSSIVRFGTSSEAITYHIRQIVLLLFYLVFSWRRCSLPEWVMTSPIKQASSNYETVEDSDIVTRDLVLRAVRVDNNRIGERGD